jgi:hypothetical protein
MVSIHLYSSMTVNNEPIAMMKSTPDSSPEHQASVVTIDGWVLLSSKTLPESGEEVLRASLEGGEQDNHLGKLKGGRVHAVVYGNAEDVSWPLHKFYAWKPPGSCL